MKSSNPKHIQSLIKSNRVKVKKRFGQNFLIDDNILNKIIETAKIDKDTFVIEIGPGLGSLTERLIPKAKHVLAYEIDNDLIPMLNSMFKEDNFSLINDDVLDRNIDEDIKAIDNEANEVVVIANLPYYITTPILMKCLETTKHISKMVVMMQFEVAKRITASTHTKDYNALSIAVQYRAKTELSFKVPKSVFIPAPNVDSAVVSLKFHNTYQDSVLSEPFFFSFVKGAFKQRRKTLLNNLHELLHIDKNTLSDILVTHKVHPQIRADKLTLETYITLANYFYQIQ
jgi:16S rRNA (adenine1518-N6/adenine1519-N6)-dimethyltransferase